MYVANSGKQFQGNPKSLCQKKSVHFAKAKKKFFQLALFKLDNLIIRLINNFISFF